VASKPSSSRQILSEAVALRAEAYRRWRRAASGQPAGDKKALYEALAHLECDRYDELVRRFLGTAPAAGTRPWPASDLASRRADGALKMAAEMAEEERRSWLELLERTADESPERPLLAALAEDAQRVRDLIGPEQH
jgi:hypothetical protein